MYDVWISTQKERPDDLPGAAGASWFRVGRLADMQSGNDIQKAVGKSGASRGVKGYIFADRSLPWTAQVLDVYPRFRYGHDSSAKDERFWLAVAISVSGGYFYKITNKPARFAVLSARPPEPHPGILGSVIALPIQLSAGRNRFRRAQPVLSSTREAPFPSATSELDIADLSELSSLLDHPVIVLSPPVLIQFRCRRLVT